MALYSVALAACAPGPERKWGFCIVDAIGFPGAVKKAEALGIFNDQEVWEARVLCMSEEDTKKLTEPAHYSKYVGKLMREFSDVEEMEKTVGLS